MTELLISIPWAALLAYVLHSNARERADLLLRIQAPERVIQRELVKSAEPGPPGIPWDDDEAYHEAIAERDKHLPHAVSELVG